MPTSYVLKCDPKEAESYAATHNLPDGISIRQSKYGCGVWATKFFPAGTRLGQYTGPIVKSGIAPSGATYYFGVGPSVKRQDLYGIDAKSSRKRRNLRTITVHGVSPIVITPEEQQPSWTRYINSVNPRKRVMLPNTRSLNVDFYQANSKIYLRTIKDVRGTPGKPVELLAWYGSDYFDLDDD